MSHTNNSLDPFFFSEMMTHPALFAHPKPRKVVIIGNPVGILQEVLKHPAIEFVYCIGEKEVSTDDSRVSYYPALSSDDHDVIIQTHSMNNARHDFFNLLNPDGILVQLCPNPLVQPNKLRAVYQQLKQMGFNDWQILNFPQTGAPSDWQAIVMSTKSPLFKRIREKDIFNKPFSTSYYNFEIHQASLALPEFARLELGLLT